MRGLAIGFLALVTALCVLGSIVAAIGLAWAWPRFRTEPEDLFALALSLAIMLLLGATAARGVVRHARPERSGLGWWEFLLAGLTVTAGLALFWLGKDPAEIDRRLFQALGGISLLSAGLLLGVVRRRDRAS